MRKSAQVLCAVLSTFILASTASAVVQPWEISDFTLEQGFIGITSLGNAPVYRSTTGDFVSGFWAYFTGPSAFTGPANNLLSDVQYQVVPTSLAGWISFADPNSAWLWVANAASPDPAVNWYFIIDLTSWANDSIVNPRGYYEPAGPGWNFQQQAVPEPSTFLMLFSFLGLGGFSWIFRRFFCCR